MSPPFEGSRRRRRAYTYPTLDLGAMTCAREGSKGLARALPRLIHPPPLFCPPSHIHSRTLDTRVHSSATRLPVSPVPLLCAARGRPERNGDEGRDGLDDQDDTPAYTLLRILHPPSITCVSRWTRGPDNDTLPDAHEVPLRFPVPLLRCACPWSDVMMTGEWDSAASQRLTLSRSRAPTRVERVSSCLLVSALLLYAAHRAK
ncbi:hypothetical protein C8R46DRAFT_1228883 [Mycena filopes]|nr:hypothetical protein C8R46DRAFT_1228883 [Mycena filopes]